MARYDTLASRSRSRPLHSARRPPPSALATDDRPSLAPSRRCPIPQLPSSPPRPVLLTLAPLTTVRVSGTCKCACACTCGAACGEDPDAWTGADVDESRGTPRLVCRPYKSLLPPSNASAVYPLGLPTSSTRTASLRAIARDCAGQLELLGQTNMTKLQLARTRQESCLPSRPQHSLATWLHSATIFDHCSLLWSWPCSDLSALEPY